MNESESPRLVLSQPPESLRPKSNSAGRVWLWLLAGLNVALLSCLVTLLLGLTLNGSRAAAPSAVELDELRSVAVELESKSLWLDAAHTWQAYLDAGAAASERAQVAYRIGKLYMQAERYGDAAAAFVRAEKATRDDPDLAQKIGPQLVECLRRMGRYGEMGRELSRRVEAGGQQTAKGRVLATISGESFHESDLDRLVERRVDGMLALQQASGDAQQREAILKQMSRPEVRQQLLQELLQTELFCRRARETGLDREESFIAARDQLEQGLLATRFLSRELEKVQPTDVDLQSYYKAHPAQYEEPETADVLAVRLEEKEKAEDLLKEIHSADDFRKLVAERSGAKDAAQAAPPVRRIGAKGQDPLLGDVAPLLALPEGQWTKQPHLNGQQRYLVLIEKKTAARVPPFEQVAGRVRTDYARIKQQELTRKLFEDLTARYQVRITSASAAEAPDRSPKKP